MVEIKAFERHKWRHHERRHALCYKDQRTQNGVTYMIRYLSKRFALLSSVVVSLALSGGVFGTFIDLSPWVGQRPEFNSSYGRCLPGCLGRSQQWQCGRVHFPVVAAKSTGTGAAPTTADFPWDTPFNVFLNTRGAQFTTPGTGFVQAPPAGADADLRSSAIQPSATLRGVQSELRIFSPIGSNITDAILFHSGHERFGAGHGQWFRRSIHRCGSG